MFRRALLLGICLASSAIPAFAGRSDGTLDIFWSDSVGGGSTLIVTPAGESVLIDKIGRAHV